MRDLIFPLIVLGAVAALLTGLGLAAQWHAPFPSEYLIAAALHAAWMLPATRRSTSAMIAAGWITTAWLCSRGIHYLYFADSEILLSIILEGTCLLLALSIAPPEPWADRLARWRRARADIVTQLRMGQGVLPWWRSCVRQFATGAADTPLGSEYQRFAAALADAEHRLRVRLSHATMPEQLRQSILENVSTIVASAETSAAQRSIEVEQKTLTAVAACREQCERMENLSASERQALAGQCEQLFLELAGH